MDKLKGILAKKKEKAQQAVGDRKWVKRAELEQLERPAKAAKVQEAPQVPERPASATALPPTAPAPAEELPDEEIKRRLRRLGEPATMFGEDSEVRRARLRHAEATMEVQDNAGAGERANELLAIRKEDREREKRSQSANASTSAAAAGPQAKGDGADAQEGAQPVQESETQRAFREAAARLQAKREREKMSADERIVHSLKGYMAEWKEDLDRRPKAAKHTTMGVQATNGYRQVERSFETLYARLQAGEVHHEIRACLLDIIDAIEQQNYLRANELYLQLSVGNQAWPIGVTSIGIHDRTAREKLSYYSNEKSQAHIMNDEATRKYLHGVSRLIKGVQGLRPTDPSRSVNFNAFEHQGLGEKGGMQKEHMLQLKAAGDTWQNAGYAQSRALMAPDGSVAVPETWGQMMRKNKAHAEAQAQDAQPSAGTAQS